MPREVHGGSDLHAAGLFPTELLEGNVKGFFNGAFREDRIEFLNPGGVPSMEQFLGSHFFLVGFFVSFGLFAATTLSRTMPARVVWSWASISAAVLAFAI